MIKKNILIVSCEPIDRFSNVGSTILSNFPNRSNYNIYQLFTNSVNNFDSTALQGSYQITTRDIFRFRIFKTRTVGREVSNDSNNSAVKITIPIIKTILNRFRNSELLRLIRDYTWYGLDWSKGGLVNWTNRIRPDLIIFLGLNNSYLYRITKEIAIIQKCPIFIYATDDYFFSNESDSFFFKIRKIALINNFKLLLDIRGSRLFTISEEMKTLYRKRLNQDSDLLFKFEELSDYRPSHFSNVKIAFTGNLSTGRWKTLVYFINLITALGLEKKIALDVYPSDKLNYHIRKASIRYDFVNIKGYVDPIEIKNTMKMYNVLLHLESFDNVDTRITKYSFSTKLTSYMSLSIPILAVGPNTINSISLLKKNKLALVIDDRDKKKSTKNLIKIFDVDLLNLYSLNSLRYLEHIYNLHRIPYFLESKINEVKSS